MEHFNPNVACNKSKRKQKAKTLWDDNTVIIFADLCLEECAKGNRPGTHFNKVGWDNLENGMFKKTGRVFDKKQLKNKWEIMKNEWKLYQRLMRETGIGGTRNMLDASPEWWDEKIKDCIGAIDGTHVKASVRQHEEAKYIGRKGYATQNIMAVCDFNMCFTFVWAGWEGTAHDTRIFNEALQRPELQFPHPTGAKYYVVDAGYPNTTGYLAPYKGGSIRYHLPDFRRGRTAAMRAPKGPQETFNYYHSSLRNIIERTFGVWKARWALLRDMHVNYTYEHQVSIVVASMAIHNYIRRDGALDEAFQRAQQETYNPTNVDMEENDTSNEAPGEGSNEAAGEGPSVRCDNRGDLHMAAVRDIIALEIVNALRR